MKRKILSIEWDREDDAFVWTLNFDGFRKSGGTLEELKTVCGQAIAMFEEHCRDADRDAQFEQEYEADYGDRKTDL